MSWSESSAATVSRESGFALIIVLWTAALLSVIAASFALSMRTEARLTTNLLEQAQAAALAEAGIRRMIVGLMIRNEDRRWKADGRTYQVPFPGGAIRMSARAETSKIDLNRASDDLIRGLLKSLGDEVDADRLADAILDWRDSDERRRVNGAEDSNYKTEGVPYGARDGPFLTVAELNQVLGMTPEIFKGIAPSLTVFSGRPRLDPATASRATLLAIPGMDEATVDTFLDQRARLLDRNEPVPPSLLPGGNRYLARSRATVYTVAAEGETGGGTIARRTAVVRLVRSRTKPFSILAWFDGGFDTEPLPAPVLEEQEAEESKSES